MTNTKTLHSDSINDNLTNSISENPEDIIVFDLEIAEEISRLNKIKTPQIHELTDRGIKLISYISGLNPKERASATESIIGDVFNRVNTGEFGFDLAGKN